MSEIPEDEKDEAKGSAAVEARFVRIPSIAERKLGPDFTAPVRLDPRVLGQMQQTIRDLSGTYTETLKTQVSSLPAFILPCCKGDPASRVQLYDVVHDIRGLAGTFGHPVLGRFARSLCDYMERCESLAHGPDETIMRFHIEAMQDALSDPAGDAALADETLKSLSKLILVSTTRNRSTG